MKKNRSATDDPPLLRYLLCGIAFLFIALFLVLPLVVVCRPVPLVAAWWRAR